MKALQLHYTSCHRGQGASAGFQIRAMTPGIQPDEQREIERRGVYRPPRTAGPNPTDEEIDHGFPRALRWYPLSTGRWALTLSSYSGRDYSGRWGNFFAHTLVFEGAPPPLWPIDYYEWEGWTRRLLPAEDTEAPPPALPVVDLGELVPAESFALSELSAFLGEEPGRTDLLAQMGRAVLASGVTSRAVVVRDSPLNGLYWVACVQKLFPPAHALGLSFSSFQDDPRGAAAVNATVEGTDFTFSEAERRYRFTQFDFATGVHSEVDAAADYPDLAAHWLAEDPSKLEAFFEFMGHFDHRALDGEELLAAAHLFEIGHEKREGIDGVRLAAMIEFAGRYTVSAGRNAIVERLGTALLSGPALPEPSDYEAAAGFLAAGAQATGQPRHRALAIALWRRLWLEEVVARGRGIEVARRTWTGLEEALPDLRVEFAEQFLDRETLGPTVERAGGLPAEALTLGLELVVASLSQLGRQPVWEQPEVTSLVAAWMAVGKEPEAAVSAVLQGAPDDSEAIVGMVHLLLKRSPASVERGDLERGAGRALGRLLAAGSRNRAEAVRRALDAPSTREVLYGEWLGLSAGAKDLDACYEAYCDAVLRALPGYGESHGSRIAASLLEQMTPEARARRAATWVLRGGVESFPVELRAKCLGLANEFLGRSTGEDADRLAALIAQRAVQDGVSLRPDRPFLRRFLAAGTGHEPTLRAADLGRLQGALIGLPGEEYEIFLATFLAPALNRVANRGEHERVLRAVWNDDLRTALLHAYREFLRSQRTSEGPGAVLAAIKFWLAFDPTKPENRLLAAFRAPVLEEIVHALSRLSKGRYASLRERMKKAGLDGRHLQLWEEIEERVAKRSSGVFGKWRRLFGRS